MKNDIGGTFEPTAEIENFLQQEGKVLDYLCRKITLDDFVAKITATRTEIIFRKAEKVYHALADRENRELDENEIEPIKKIAIAQTNSYLARKARVAFEILKEFGVIANFQIADAISAIKNKQ